MMAACFAPLLLNIDQIDANQSREVTAIRLFRNEINMAMHQPAKADHTVNAGGAAYRVTYRDQADRTEVCITWPVYWDRERKQCAEVMPWQEKKE